MYDGLFYWFDLMHCVILIYRQSQSREVASLRTRNVELEGDVERLRRQLTSEKFERYVRIALMNENWTFQPL